MSANAVTVIACVICLALGAGGYWLYLDQQRSGVSITVGRSGVAIEQR